MNKIKSEILNLLEGIEVHFDHSLKQFNTWKIDTKAEIIIIVKSSIELETVLSVMQILNLNFRILGKGSNILVPDEKLQGVVIINKSKVITIHDEISNDRIIDFDKVSKSQKGIELYLDNSKTIPDFKVNDSYFLPKNKEFVQARHKEHDLLDFSDLGSNLVDLEEVDYKVVSFDSGVDLSYAINWTHKNNLSGLQFFAGIPSTMGGALFNNIHGGDRHLSDKFLLACIKKKIMRKPLAILISGPSGVGKSTLYERLLKERGDIFEHLVSCTTRSPREGEIDGQTKHFISESEFKEMIDNDEFIEYEKLFNGSYYGTSKKELERIKNNGKIAITDIDVKGANSFKEIYGDDVMTIMIKPPSFDDLIMRLKKRGDKGDLSERLERVNFEISMSHRYDYELINDDLEKTYNFLSSICLSEYYFKKKYVNIKDMNFGYDKSLLRDDRDISIIKVYLLLPVVDEKIAKQSQLNAMTWLKRKKIQPRNSCGSVFQSLPEEIAKKHNLPVQAVGYIIDKKLNWKGKKNGAAQIYEKHANFIVSNEGIKSKDISELVSMIKNEIKEKLGIEIHEEFDYLK